MNPKPTAFLEIHKALGGKIVEFAGFEMPVQYTGIIEEHRRVREHVGLFDVSHMGEFEVRGKDALAFVQSVTVNDASKLRDGRVQYSALCYDDGGIVDDLLVYSMGDHFMLVVNASNIDKDFTWLQGHCRGDVQLQNRSDEFSLLAVQGPRAIDALAGLTAVDLAAIPYYHFVRGTLAGVDMLISRTGYTGELGFELYFPSDRATGAKVWSAIMEGGKKSGIGPTGLGARDTLRLEMGYCLYGNDIDKTTNPLEAGLGWITKLDKGDFIGRDALLRVRDHGLTRKLVGFRLDDKAFPRHGYAIRAGGRDIGTVTSGTYSPSLDAGIGMGYVESGLATPGTSIAIVIRNREIPASVVAVPFVKKP